MANNTHTTPRFTKTGPKRLRRTRRELPEGQYSQWGHCVTHFKREREQAYIRSMMEANQ